MEEGREYNTCGENYYASTISQVLYIYPHLIPTITLTTPFTIMHKVSVTILSLLMRKQRKKAKHLAHGAQLVTAGVMKDRDLTSKPWLFLYHISLTDCHSHSAQQARAN